MSRSHDIIGKLGRDALAAALKSNKPWQSIKQLANQHIQPFKLVLPHELEQVVKSKVAQKKQFGSQGNKKFAAHIPAPINASDLRIPPGVFVYPNGQPVQQIELRQIRQVGRGLVVCSETECQPYLNGEPVTADWLLWLLNLLINWLPPEVRS